MTALFSKQQDIDKSQSEYIISFKASSAEIHCDEEFAWTLDGEYGGKEKDITIKNNRKAIDFIVNTSLA